MFNDWTVITTVFATTVGLAQLTFLRGRMAMNAKEIPRRRILSALFLAEMWIIVIIGLW